MFLGRIGIINFYYVLIGFSMYLGCNFFSKFYLGVFRRVEEILDFDLVIGIWVRGLEIRKY